MGARRGHGAHTGAWLWSEMTHGWVCEIQSEGGWLEGGLPEPSRLWASASLAGSADSEPCEQAVV